MSITPNISCSRVSGVAPIGVVFDASSTVSSATSYPFHELSFEWDFGDPQSGTWAFDGKSKNRDFGPIAAHVYRYAGRYRARCTIRNTAGERVTWSQYISVTIPEVVFSGTKTICINKSGDSDFAGAPTGAQTVQTDSWDTIVSTYCVAGNRVLLKRGSTWTWNSTPRTINNTGPGLLGAYGSGANPIVVSATSGAQAILQFGSSSVTRDWRIVDVDFQHDTQANGWNVLYFSSRGCHDMLVLGSAFSKVNTPISISPWGCQDYETVHNGIVLAETTISTIKEDSVNNPYCAYTGCTRQLAVLGNDWYNDYAAGSNHLFRSEWLQRSVFAHNKFRHANTGHCLKLNAPLWSGYSWSESVAWPVAQYSERVYVGSNLMYRLSAAGTGPWDHQIAPQNADRDERIRDVLFEGNYQEINDAHTYPVWLVVAGDNVTVRNNVLKVASKTSRDFRFSTLSDESQPTPQNLWIYNNSVYYPGGSDESFRLCEIGSGISAVTARNNVVKCPSITDRAWFSGSGSGTQSNNDFRDTPGWATDPPTQASHYDLVSTSACRAAGYASGVPVERDFNWDSRPYGVANDQGAFCFGSDSPAENVSLVRAGQTISSISGDGSVVTVGLSATYPNSNLKRGQKIRISGTTNYNGVYTIANVASQTSFTFASAATGSEATGTAGGHYTSLTDWESNERASCTANQAHEVAEVYDDWSGGLVCSSQLVLNTGWTTDRKHRIVIRAPYGERSLPGGFGTGVRVKYSGFAFPSGHDNGMLQIQTTLHVTVEGVEFDGTGASSQNSVRGIQVYNGGGGGGLVCRDVICRDQNTAAGAGDAFDIDCGGSSGYVVQLENCIASGFGDDGISFSHDQDAGYNFSTDSYCHNCLIYGPGTGNANYMGFHSFSGCNVVLLNCVSANTGTEFEGGSGYWGSGSGYLASNHTVGPAFGTGSITGISVSATWTDAANDDFTLLNASSPLVGKGTTEGITHTRDARGFYLSGPMNIGPISNPGFFGRRTFTAFRNYDDATDNKSGLAYQETEDLLYVVRNNHYIRKLYRDGSYYATEPNPPLASPPFDDTESIERLRDDHPLGDWAIVNEGDTNPAAVAILVCDLAKDASAPTNVVKFACPTIATDYSGGFGAEGLVYSPSRGTFFVSVQTPAGTGEYGLWEVDVRASSPVQTLLYRWYDTLVASGAIASNWILGDLAHMEGAGYDESYFLLCRDVNSQNGRVLELDRAGNVLSTLTGIADGQTEGLCFDLPMYNLFVTGEQTGTDYWHWTSGLKGILDAAAGSDAVALAATTKVVSDSGSAADALSGLLAALGLTDAGAGADDIDVDTGGAAEKIVLLLR